jgi:hypothetical protein
MKKIITQNLSYLYPVVLFFLISLAYFLPDVIQGRQLFQSDVLHFQGMAKEIMDYREQYGEEPLWTNSMFGGMPAYLISTIYKTNFLRHVHSVMTIFNFRPVCFIFLYLLGFYIALLLFDVNKWLSFAGAIAYAFSSYFFIIITAGHVSKVFALGYMPPIVAGVYAALRGRPVAGSITAGVFLGLQIVVNHLQITYYTLLAVMILIIFEFAGMVKESNYKSHIKPAVMLALFVILAIGANLSTLWTTYEYGKYSVRGKSELTANNENQSSGLDRDYATYWSYGIDETLTLLIPDFKGGSSNGHLSSKSETYRYIAKNYNVSTARDFSANAPIYHGSQPSTSGPVYAGATVVFLFILGLFLLKGPVKWWLLTITAISVLLSWGKNFPLLTNFMFDYFPGYNKFRTVSMTLVIAEFSMPLLAVLTLREIMEGRIEDKYFNRIWKYALFGTGGFLLLILLLSGSFNYTALPDEDLTSQGLGLLVTALQKDRLSILRLDTFRSLIFTVITAFIVLAIYKKKVKPAMAIVLISAAFLIDMWPVNKRYLNSDNFVSKRNYQNSFAPTAADTYILQDHDIFRVLNMTVSTFQDASTSYFHQSVGGYHGAKMERYQEIIDYHLIPEITKMGESFKEIPEPWLVDTLLKSMKVLNMLNTRYYIYNPDTPPFVNKYALGNAWFVDGYIPAANADDEIMSLSKADLATQAVIDKRYEASVQDMAFGNDTSASIELSGYKPNHLTYSSTSSSERLAVFSEIYYDKGWNVYIDGQQADYFRADYLLRAMKVPAGKHTIEFIFHPVSFYTGEKISLASSVILLLLVAGSLLNWIKQRVIQ